MEDKARYGVLRYPLLFTETIQVDSDFAEQLRRETPVYPGWGVCADEIHLRYGFRVALQSRNREPQHVLPLPPRP